MTFLNTVTRCAASCTSTTWALTAGASFSVLTGIALLCTRSKVAELDRAQKHGLLSTYQESLIHIAGKGAPKSLEEYHATLTAAKDLPKAFAPLVTEITAAHRALEAAKTAARQVGTDIITTITTRIGDNADLERLKGEFEARQTALNKAKTPEQIAATLDGLVEFINDNQEATLGNDDLFKDNEVEDWTATAANQGTLIKAQAALQSAVTAANEVATRNVRTKAQKGGAEVLTALGQVDAALDALVKSSFAKRLDAAKHSKATPNQKYGLQSPCREEIFLGAAALISFSAAAYFKFVVGTPAWLPAPIVGVKA